MSRLLRQALDLARNPAYSGVAAGLCFLADCALTAVVVWKIPYTEIDWRAYMQQIALFMSGERDYMRLVGDTGPLVYPAVHVWIYRALYAFTSQGKAIAAAQLLFAAVYLGTLALVMQTYLRAKVPPYVFPLLVGSKRLHSVFVLRLFNDCFAELCLVGAVACWQRRRWAAGSVIFSLGVGVKMVVLLALPAVGAMLWQAVGRERALSSAAIMAQVQHPHLGRHRLLVCEKPTLPILRVHRVVDAVPPVAERATSGAHLHRLGGAGMGLERVSQHRRLLDGGRGMPRFHRRQHLGRH
nr:dol-p-man:man(5)glcnac(2)-pp-dol alpha-1,3-mannosyltransferase [Quercus suber]